MKATFLIAFVLCVSVYCAYIPPKYQVSPNRRPRSGASMASQRNPILEALVSGHTFYGKSSIIKADIISDNVQRDITLVKATYQMDIAALNLNLHIEPFPGLEGMYRLAYALVLVRAGKSAANLNTDLYDGNSAKSHRDVYDEPKNVIIYDYPTISHGNPIKLDKSYKFIYPMKIPMMPGDTIRLVYKAELADPGTLKIIKKNIFVGLISGHLSFLDEQDARNYVDNRLEKVYN